MSDTSARYPELFWNVNYDELIEVNYNIPIHLLQVDGCNCQYCLNY